jgi:transposase
MDIIKREREILLLKVTKEHFVGEDLIHIDFEEIFQLFNQDALEKCLFSSYVL